VLSSVTCMPMWTARDMSKQVHVAVSSFAQMCSTPIQSAEYLAAVANLLKDALKKEGTKSAELKKKWQLVAAMLLCFKTDDDNYTLHVSMQHALNRAC
jgi:hypothetical protein